jgi:hypothetical protein
MHLLIQIFLCLAILYTCLYVWVHMHTLIDPEAWSFYTVTTKSSQTFKHSNKINCSIFYDHLNMQTCHDWCRQKNQKMPQQIWETTTPFTFQNQHECAYTIFRPRSDTTWLKEHPNFLCTLRKYRIQNLSHQLHILHCTDLSKVTVNCMA